MDLRMDPDSGHRQHQQRQQQQQQHELAQLRVGWLSPRIWPASYEAQYWRSDWYARLARDKDNWNLFLRICHETLFMFRFCAGAPLDAIRPIRRACANCAMLVAVQQATRLLCPDAYRNCRWVLVIHQRVYFFLIHVAILKSIRRATVGGIPGHVVDTYLMYQGVQGISDFRTLRALLIGSASIWSVIDAFPVRAPYLLELIMPFLYLCASFHIISPLAGQYFSHPRFTDDTRHFCHSLATFTAPTWLLPPAVRSGLRHATHSLAALLHTPNPPPHRPVPPPHAAPPHICDTIQHAWVLVLFFLLYVTYAATTYLVVQLERRSKQSYIRHLQQRRQQPSSSPPTSPGPEAQDAAASTAAPSTASPSAGLTSSPLSSRQRTAPISVPPNPHPAAPAPDPPSTNHRRKRLAPSTSRAARLVLHLLQGSLRHVLCLWLLGVLMWQVALALHQPLVRFVVPVNLVGGHTDWFWELRCGSPHPCCPVT